MSISSSKTALIPELPQELSPYLMLSCSSSPLGVPICTVCKTALLPQSIPEHLRKTHSFPPSLRPILNSFLSSLPSSIQDLTFSSLPSLPHNSVPTPELRVQTCFQCLLCEGTEGYIRKDVTDVRRHVNKVHERGAKGGMEEVEAQSWFGGRNKRYWRVDVGKVDIKGPGCVWGLFGTGWGDKLPRSWPMVDGMKEVEVEREREDKVG